MRTASLLRGAVRAAGACAAFSVLLAASPMQSLAVSTSFWRTDTFEQAAGGHMSGTSVLRDGRIVLGPDFEKLELPASEYVWGAVERRDGTVVVAAGTPGVVYELGPGGPRELLSDDTADFPAIALAPSGDVFVGTAPGGQVYRISPDGSSELFFETGEGYVWCLAYSRGHGLLVGTGEAARVYAVDDAGSGRVVYESTESSITALSATGDTVLAGTAMEGLLLDVTPGRDLRVVYDAAEEEISGIARAADGTVYFAATTVSMEDVLNDSGSGVGEGAVYRVTPTGAVVEVWRSMDAPVTALGVVATGDVLAGTGAGGRLFAVGGAAGADLVAEPEGEDVLFVGTAGAGLVTLGGPGRAYRVSGGAARSGEYESDVLDTRSVSRWGDLSWRAELPPGSRVRFFVRSGNTGDADETWSDWFEVEGEGAGAMRCPAARYLQWKALLERSADSAGPEVRRVESAYLRENLAPLLAAVVVHDPGDVVSAVGGDDGSVRQVLPDGVEVTYSMGPGAPDEHTLPVLTRGLRTASWDAADPNGDALSFDLYVLAEDERVWKRLEGGIRGRTLHTWDTLTMTDGTYRLKVVASDRPSNAAAEAREVSAVSAPFIVDHTPPELSRLDVRWSGGEMTVGGRVKDAATPVVAVDVSVDYGEWRPAFAEDGMFDSRSEAFRLVLEDVEPGEHAVAVRAIDRAGNPVVGRRVVGEAEAAD